MARLLDCDAAYLLGDGEDGQSLQSAVSITERTGLSDEAARKIIALKDGKEIAALSMLIEWDEFEGLMQSIQDFTAFQAVANLEAYERDIYEESRQNPQKAVDFFARKIPAVRFDSSAYSDMLETAETLEREDLRSSNEQGSFLQYKTEKCLGHFLEYIACRADLDD